MLVIDFVTGDDRINGIVSRVEETGLQLQFETFSSASSLIQRPERSDDLSPGAIAPVLATGCSMTRDRFIAQTDTGFVASIHQGAASTCRIAVVIRDSCGSNERTLRIPDCREQHVSDVRQLRCRPARRPHWWISSGAVCIAHQTAIAVWRQDAPPNRRNRALLVVHRGAMDGARITPTITWTLSERSPFNPPVPAPETIVEVFSMRATAATSPQRINRCPLNNVEGRSP